jgi:hypothetical protein
VLVGLGDGVGVGVSVGLGLGLGVGVGVLVGVGVGVLVGVGDGVGVGKIISSSITHELLYSNIEVALLGTLTVTPEPLVKSLYVTPVAGNEVLTLVAILAAST